MKKPDKVHILFERSGTFLKAFEKLGIEAIDYDLESEHDAVVKTDIFHEIDKFYVSQNWSILSKMKPDDLVLAFFPCTYFSDQSQLISRCDSYSMQNYPLEKKIKIAEENMDKRAEFFKKLCQLVYIADILKLRLIIENPFGKVNFLKWFFPLKPGIVINDRRAWGDFFKKPTQFFFVNCETEFFLDPTYGNVIQKKSVKATKGFSRSRISSTFADNFIEWVLKDESWE